MTTSRFRKLCWIAIFGVLSTSALMAQSKRPGDLAVGKLIVVPRGFSDPNFAYSVVLLVRHDADGTVGLMINRRSQVPGSRVLSDLEGADNYPDPIFLGGPVDRGVVMALLQSQTEPQDADRVLGGVYLLSTKDELEAALKAGTDPENFRIYLGYCGWAPGQLENEVSRGDWYIFDGSEKLFFDSDPSTLWSRMIARTEQKIARLR